MVSVEKWKNHFKQLAHKAFPHEDMYIVAQSGRGLGWNAYKRTLYQIRAPRDGAKSAPTVEIVSPIASTLGRAKALTKTIKRKRKKRSSSSTRSRVGKKTKKKSPATAKKKGKGRKKKKTTPPKAVTAVVKAALAAGARQTKKRTSKKTRRRKKK